MRSISRRLRTSFLRVAGAALLAYLGFAAYRWSQRAPTVEVEVTSQESVSRILALTGRVRPRLVNEVVPLVSGRLVELRREEGDPMRKGDVLARIDERSAKAILAQERARERVRQEEIAQERRELERAQGLFDNGLIPRSSLEDARLAVERSEQTLAQLREAVVEAETRLDDFVLRAPFAGYVLRRPIDPGQTVSPSTVVYEIGTAAALVEAEVDERFLAELAPGMRASISPLNGAGATYDATLSFVSRQVDPRSGAAMVRLEFEGDAPDLPAGLSVAGNLDRETGFEILEVLRSISASEGTAFLISTHDPVIARRCDRTVEMVDGRLVH